MNSWAEDLLLAIGKSVDVEAAFSRISRAAVELGFEWCAYGVRFPLPITSPQVLIVNNYLTGWQQRYADENYLTIDPTVSHCATTSVPVIWSDKVFSESPVFWDEAREMLINRPCWARPVHA